MAYEPNQAGAELLNQMQQQQLMRDLYRVQGFNKNPKQFSASEVPQIASMAQQYGIDISQGMRKDKASLGENMVAGVGGAADAFVFGLIPDSWYSNYRTNSSKSLGKIVGSLLSFAIPGLGAAAGAKNILGIGSAAFKAGKASATTLGGFKSDKSAADGVAMMKLLMKGGMDAGKAAYAVALAGNSASKARRLAQIAHALVRGNQAMGATSSLLNPSRYGEQAPYVPIDSTNGMPGMQ